MPAHSTHDADMIRKWMRRGELFCNVHDNDARRRIEERILECRRVVTIDSFIEDSRLLKALADGLYKLLPLEERGKRSLRENFKTYFEPRGKNFQNSYTDICFRALRDFGYYSQGKFSGPLKDKGQPTPEVQPPNHEKLGTLAYFAAAQGFETQRIHEWIARAPKPLVLEPAPTEIPELSNNDTDLPQDSRSNRPHKGSYDGDCKYLSSENVSQPSENQCKLYPTSFAVIRDQVLRFWADCVSTEQETPRLRNQGNQPNHLGGLVVGVSNDSGNFPGPASSVYDCSVRAPSVSFSPCPRSSGGEEPWSARDFVGLCDQPYDNSSMNDMCADDRAPEGPVQDISMQISEVDGDVQLAHNPATFGTPRRMIEYRAPTASLQVEQNLTQQGEVEEGEPRQALHELKQGHDRLEQTEDGVHRPAKGPGPWERQYRITRYQQRGQNSTANRQKETIIKAWQNQGEDSRQRVQETSSTELVTQSQSANMGREALQSREADGHNVSILSEENDNRDEHGLGFPHVQVHIRDDAGRLSVDNSAAIANELNSTVDSVPQHQYGEETRNFGHLDQRSALIPYESPVSLVAPSEEVWVDEGSLVSPLASRSSELERGEDSQLLQEQTLTNDVTEENDSALTRQLEPGRNAQKKTLTHQQVQDEATQRRKKKRGLRSRLARKLKGQFEEAGTNSHESANEEWHGQAHQNDAEQSDVREEMREAEEHICSAVEVVDEVYDDSATDDSIHLEHEDKESNVGGVAELDSATTCDPRNTSISLFPGGGVGPWLRASKEDSVQGRYTGLLKSGEVQTEPKRQTSFRHDKRKAVRDAGELLGSLAGNPLPEIQTQESNVKRQDAVSVDQDPSPHLDPPVTPFPGPSFSSQKTTEATMGAPSSSQAVQLHTSSTGATYENEVHARFPLPNTPGQVGEGDLTSSSEISRRRFADETVQTDTQTRALQYHRPAQLRDGDYEVASNSKKRNFPNESEDTGVQLRLPRNPKQAQLNNWEPFKEIVDLIRRIWSELDHARIYVTSPVEIEELATQQHPTQRRLWSWSKEDKEGFNRQIGLLLQKKFGFQVVCSDAHLQPRQYCSLHHMEYWKAYFESTRPRYWLAVLTPWRTADTSWKKVRKTSSGKNHDVENT